MLIVNDMEGVDTELTSELLELRWRLSYKGTLAYFDVWAASAPEPFDARL